MLSLGEGSRCELKWSRYTVVRAEGEKVLYELVSLGLLMAVFSGSVCSLPEAV